MTGVYLMTTRVLFVALHTVNIDLCIGNCIPLVVVETQQLVFERPQLVVNIPHPVHEPSRLVVVMLQPVVGVS